MSIVSKAMAVVWVLTAGGVLGSQLALGIFNHPQVTGVFYIPPVIAITGDILLVILVSRR